MRKSYLEWAKRGPLKAELMIRKIGDNEFNVVRDRDLKTIFSGDDIGVVDFVTKKILSSGPERIPGGEEVVLVNQDTTQAARISARDVTAQALFQMK